MRLAPWLRRDAELLALLLMAASIPVYSLRATWPSDLLWDYEAWVGAGLAMARGGSPYQPGPGWTVNLNTPASLPLCQLLSAMDPVQGRAAWWFASLAVYLLALALLIRRYPDRARPMLLVWCLANTALWYSVGMGQIYTVLMFPAVGAWLLLERGRQLPAGLLIGIVLAVKPILGIWVLALLLSGRYRAVVAVAGSFLAITGASALVYSPGLYLEWWRASSPEAARFALVPTNGSLLALAARWGVPALGIAASGAVLAALALRARSLPVDRLNAAAIAASLLVSPIAWPGYLLFLLPAFFALPPSRLMVAAAALALVPNTAVLWWGTGGGLPNLLMGATYTLALLAVLASSAQLTTSRNATPGSERGPSATMISSQ